MLVQFVLLVFGLNLHVVTAFISGRVDGACFSMIPGHNGINSSTLDPPYTVTSDVLNYTDGQVITVTLQANQTGFRGFLLQARNETGPVGNFTVMGSNAQLLNCGAEGSAVSHTSNDEKSTIVAQWKAPSSNNRDIRFRATFVQNFSLFWVGVESHPVRYLATNPPNATVLPPNVTVSITSTTVLPPNATVSTTNTTVLPPNATVSTTNTTVLPPNATVSTTNTTVFPPNATVSTTNTTVLPPNATVSTTNTTVLPPNTTTDDNSSSSVSVTLCLLLLPLLTIM